VEEPGEQAVWVAVGRCQDIAAATGACALLGEQAIPATINAAGASGECLVLVPAGRVAAARAALQPPQVPDAELTAQALASPPPDDYEPPAKAAAATPLQPAHRRVGRRSRLLQFLDGLRGIRSGRDR
jgi:hypothetical protein